MSFTSDHPKLAVLRAGLSAIPGAFDDMLKIINASPAYITTLSAFFNRGGTLAATNVGPDGTYTRDERFSDNFENGRIDVNTSVNRRDGKWSFGYQMAQDDLLVGEIEAKFHAQTLQSEDQQILPLIKSRKNMRFLNQINNLL